MELTKKEIAEAISSHQFKLAIPYLLDDVKWNLIGGETLMGKAKVVETCEMSAAYLSGVTTKFNKFNAILAEDAVIIDSLAEYLDGEGATSTVASCDIYRFEAGKVSEITSYNIEIKP